MNVEHSVNAELGMRNAERRGIFHAKTQSVPRKHETSFLCSFVDLCVIEANDGERARERRELGTGNAP